MKKIIKSELNDVLINVRKSYRLLFEYQRRVLDTVQFIASLLPSTINEGYSIFSEIAYRNGAKINLRGSAWDWLNFYLYEVYFTDIAGDGKIQFAINIVSDTGFFDIEGIAKTDVKLFTPCEKAKSKLIFLVGKNQYWKPNNYNERSELFKTEATSEIKSYETNDRIFLAKAYDLQDL